MAISISVEEGPPAPSREDGIEARHEHYVNQVQRIRRDYRDIFDSCVLALVEASKTALANAIMLDTIEFITRRRLTGLYETQGAQLARDLEGNQEYKVAPPGNEDFTTWSEHGLPDDLVAHALAVPEVEMVDDRIVARRTPGRKRRRFGDQEQQQEQQEQQ